MMLNVHVSGKKGVFFGGGGGWGGGELYDHLNKAMFLSFRSIEVITSLTFNFHSEYLAILNGIDETQP